MSSFKHFLVLIITPAVPHGAFKMKVAFCVTAVFTLVLAKHSNPNPCQWRVGKLVFNERSKETSSIRIRLGHESLDVTLAYLKVKDAESEEAQEHANSSSWRCTHKQ
jgi:hypothetical protein